MNQQWLSGKGKIENGVKKGIVIKYYLFLEIYLFNMILMKMV